MAIRTDLLIIGAGPFGLSMAAYAKHHNIDHLVVGRPMDFWKSNMPKGMLLRSASDWHLDPLEISTIEMYLETMNLARADVEPLSLDFYLSYTRWFREEKQIEPLIAFVDRLDCSKSPDHEFEAMLNTGEIIKAKSVLLAIGFANFKNIPEELAAIFPTGRFSHTCDLVALDHLREKRCLVIGGRQSAFEWTALLHEAGATHVDVSYRHETPAFTKSDWSWVTKMIAGMVEDPAWFRNLSPELRQEVNQRFWAEGRLKLEPWLWPRINKQAVELWPKSQVVSCRQLPSGELEVELDVGQVLTEDHVILATGYKVNMRNVPFLSNGNILEGMNMKNGFPALDEHFQSNIPGLFITSMPATQDFGAFFAFTVSATASAKIIGSAIKDGWPKEHSWA